MKDDERGGGRGEGGGLDYDEARDRPTGLLNLQA